MEMKTTACALAIMGLAACSSGAEPVVVARPHTRLAKASLLPGQQIPSERDGVRVEDTGAIMFICSDAGVHEDKEVFISKCPSCSELNYFYWNSSDAEFICFACTKSPDAVHIKCPDCGRPPRVVRTRPKPNK